jgi:hypothetical protein
MRELTRHAEAGRCEILSRLPCNDGALSWFSLWQLPHSEPPSRGRQLINCALVSANSFPTSERDSSRGFFGIFDSSDMVYCSLLSHEA